MRILLDECLPRELAQELIGPEVRTVQQQGWAGLKNGGCTAAHDCRDGRAWQQSSTRLTTRMSRRANGGSPPGSASMRLLGRAT